MEVDGRVQHGDLLDVVEHRYKLASIIVTSQLNPDDWYAAIGDAPIADAICDRLLHNAHSIR